MTDTQINPSRITKPIQLLGAWLIGLFTVNAAFLAAASKLPEGRWEASALVIAAIVNVPLFLLSLFLLQTKFRPELQEDSFYSTYINQKTNQTVSVSRDEQRFTTFLSRLERVENAFSSKIAQEAADEAANLLSTLRIGVNKHMPNRQEFVQKLKAAGAKAISSFGDNEMPPRLILSLSNTLPQRTEQAILETAKKLGFSTYNYYDAVMEDIHEHVLFGSYGTGELEIG
ncbi:hypothetical protein LMG26686_02793 [Achromobacter mucicolens]|uniref:hypothetical protein n=1 Tax=Achromobacter mucicolens TaxID=1389922 RepID=UPI0014685AFE|nr:hypothetical protein [Achromobacter mucicolens]CAB3867663.1 hypothetical protein LMG26686_02793 [Achromobacter mucicolens]